MVMGDLVLFQDEVNRALSVALENAIDVTALHNHFFFDQPKVYFMHISGEGKLDALALGVKRTLQAARIVRARVAVPQASFGGRFVAGHSAINGVQIEKILAVQGQAKDGMFKVVIGRQTTAACGCTVGKDMGVNTWAAFAGNDDNPVVDGDFAVLEDELQGVLKELRAANINVVAIHNHTVAEHPRFIFLHYWAKGRVAELAAGLKRALDLTSPSNGMQRQCSEHG